MINADLIKTVEDLIEEDTPASLTYAALECRLAIERICYERLRLAHVYISNNELKRWQPQGVVNTLIQEVDSYTASTFTLYISKEPLPDDAAEPTLEDYQATEFVNVGTQVGFDTGKLGKLWNALSHLALHVKVPASKDDMICRYGDPERIKEKVAEALEEIKRIDEASSSLLGSSHLKRYLFIVHVEKIIREG